MGNWSNGVPTSGTNVLIDNGNANLQGASAVTLNIAGVANNLTVDSDDSLNFNDNTSLTVNGTSISNAGSISLNSSNNATDLIIAGNNTVTLSGGGTLTMGNNGANRVYSAGGTGTLINQETIQGGGQLGVNQLTLDNQGTIDANVGTPLIVQPGSGGVTNTATMEASSGGTLDLQGSYTNTGGLIEALAGSTVKLDNATITGGTLTTSGGGVMESINSVTLKGVTISTGSAYSEPDNTSTTLQGTITNNGNIQLNSSNNATDLHISGPVTLTGTGTVTMGNNGANRIYAPNGTDTLTNKQTIQGGGQLGVGSLTLVNQGTIDANVATPLIVSPGSGGATNTATMEASSGGTLDLQGGYINTGGLIEGLAGSTVKLDGAAITGGTLTTTSTGMMESINTATLNGVTISKGSTYLEPDNTTTILQGTITNNGTIQLASSNNATDLHISGPVTLTGTGTVTMGNNGANRIYAPNGTDVLTNKETIQGGGQLGVNSMGLINSGTILANQPTALLIQTSGSGFKNAGTLSVSAADFMHVSGGPFTNFSGSTLTGGTYNVTGTLEIDELGSTGGEIVTNAANIILNTPASSFVDAAGKNALTNLNTNATGSSFAIIGGQNFTTIGNFTNNGTLTIGASTSKFDVNGNLTNFSGTTLTGGTYNVTGTLQFNGANIVTNAANITLTGASSQIIDQSSANGLANFATNAPAATFGITGGRNFTTAGNFTNNGTLTIGASTSKFGVNGNLSNFSGTTLTGGTYNVTGTLQFNGANIVTNAANITLTGASSKIIDQLSANGLANLAANASTGSFTVAGGRTLTTLGAFTNSGTLTTTGIGSEFTAGGNFINNKSLTTTGGDSEVATISSASFTNNGTLTVGTGSKFSTGGSLSNFSGTTLTGGIYNLTGTLQFNGANIVTNAANITLTGASSQIVNQLNANGLANFATNASTGSFTVAGGRKFTTVGAFTNSGTLTTTGSGSAFTAAGNFINTGSLTTTGGDSEVATISSASFTNNGTLTVGSASKFSTAGSLSNFSGTTLTGGTYNLTGMLQFTGANIVSNAANISLIGSGSKIVDQTGTTDGLRNFANNSATGMFGIAGGRNFTTAGSFTNTGTFSIGTGSTFTLGALGNFTQTAGKTTDDGILSTSGMVSLTAGSLFGKGTVAGVLQSSGTITPGDSSTSTGALNVSKTYTQNSSGVLDIAIGGTTAGTKYDQLNVTGAATLNGTLNLSLINGFVPAIGTTTFEILNASSVSGTFSTVNGTAINGTEHFVVACDTTDCDVTVASGASVPAKPNLAAAFSAYNAVLPTLRTHSGFGSQAMRSNLNDNFIRTANIADSSRIHIGASPYPSMLRRDVVQNDSLRLGPVRIRAVGAFRTSIPAIHDFTKLQASFGAGSSFLALRSQKVVSDLLGRNAFSLNRNAAFRPIRSFIAGTTEHNLFRPGFNGLVRSGVSGPAAGLPRNAKALRGNRIEYGFDLLSIFRMNRGSNFGRRSEPLLNNRFGYLMVTNSY